MNDYNINLCTLSAFRAYARGYKNFKLTFRTLSYRKIDCVEFSIDGIENQCIILNGFSKKKYSVNFFDLFDDPYIKELSRFKNENSKQAIVLTTSQFNTQDDRLSKMQIESKQLDESSKIIIPNIDNKIYKFIVEKAEQQIVYATVQPTDDEFFDEIIKKEIENHFKLSVKKNLIGYFQCYITNEFSQLDKNYKGVLNFNKLDKFFQNNIKNVKFNTILPCRIFKGRRQEIEKLKNNIETDRLIFIIGASGIGKTELVSQYYFNHRGKEFFYHRIVWINGLNDTSIYNSFLLCCYEFNISSSTVQSSAEALKLILDYFCGLKVLFVFDNFYERQQELTAKENEFIQIYQDVIEPAKNVSSIFISNHTKSFIGLFDPKKSINLDVLKKPDAIDLIKSELHSTDYPFDEKKTSDFVEELKCNLKALQLAVSYIKKQRMYMSVCGKKYQLKEFLIDLKERKKKDFEIIYKYINQHELKNVEFKRVQLKRKVKNNDIKYETRLAKRRENL